MAPAFTTHLWIQKFESFRSSGAVQSWGGHFRVKANRRHFPWLGWRPPVSACYFPISVSAWRRPVRFFMETGSHGAHRRAVIAGALWIAAVASLACGRPSRAGLPAPPLRREPRRVCQYSPPPPRHRWNGRSTPHLSREVLEQLGIVRDVLVHRVVVPCLVPAAVTTSVVGDHPVAGAA